MRLILPSSAASAAYVAFVSAQNESAEPFSLDELLAFSQLYLERRVDAATIGRLTQRGEPHARSVLERLVERGLAEARGERHGRVYHFSAALYRRLGAPAGYVRTHGFDAIQQEAMVLQYTRAHGRITRREAMRLCNLDEDQASRLLRRLARANKLRLEGSRHGAFYMAVAE